MSKYSSPKDRQDAARSPVTSPDELYQLAMSDYGFVRLAVARNPNARPDTLRRLLPLTLSSWNDQDLAAAIIEHPGSSQELLALIAGMLVPVLDNGRDNHMAFRAGMLLCSQPTVDFTTIRKLLDAPTVATQFRKVVARECTRADVVAHLSTNRSETVRRRALENLVKLGAA